MKRYIAAAIAAIAGCGMMWASQAEVADSAAVEMPVPGDYVYDTARNFDFSYLPEGSVGLGESQWDVSMGSLALGWSGAVGQPSGLDIEPSKSFEVSWLNCLAVGWRNRSMHTRISLGVGVGWRNYKLTTPVRFVTDEGVVGLGSYPEGVEPRSSRLKVFSLQFPLLWTQGCGFRMLGSEFTVTAGAVLCVNTHGSLRTAWTDDRGVDVSLTSNSISQRKLTVDLFGAVRVCPLVGLYVRWSPMKVLREPGLQFSPLSGGLLLFY